MLGFPPQVIDEPGFLENGHLDRVRAYNNYRRAKRDLQVLSGQTTTIQVMDARQTGAVTHFMTVNIYGTIMEQRLSSYIERAKTVPFRDLVKIGCDFQ
jgi:hypothetical protein